MNHTPVTLSSRALLKIGATAITSFADDNREAVIAHRLYPEICDSLLCAHPWSFARWRIALQSTPIQDQNDIAFCLPSDFLRAITVDVDGHTVPYRILGSYLYVPSQRARLTYIRRRTAETFPAFFIDALIARLSAEFCLPLTENSSRAERLTRQAKQSLRHAQLIDSQQQTPKSIDHFPLIEARR